MVQIKFSRAEFCEWAKGSRSVKVYKYKSVISMISNIFSFSLRGNQVKEETPNRGAKKRRNTLFYF